MTTSREFLERQEQVRREELRDAEEKVKYYIRDQGGVPLDAAGTKLVSEIDGLQVRIEEAEIELGSLKGSLAAVERELKTVSPQLAQRIASRLDLRIQAVQTKLAELEVAREEILLHNPGKAEAELSNTRLPQIDRQIAQLRSQMEELSEKYVEEVAATGGVSSGEQGLTYVAGLKRQAAQERIKINGLEQKIEVMRTRLKDARNRLGNIPQHSIELTRLERARKQAEEMYNYVVQQLQSIRIDEETEPGYAHILRDAVVPSRPVRPDHGRNMILGAFFGILFAVGTALVRDKLDNRIYKPDSLRDDGYPVIGVVPDMQGLQKKEFGKRSRVQKDGRYYATSLVSLLRPFSMISESYCHVRTKVQFSIPDRMVQTILVTSPGIGEGKSTTAANLAVVMAEAERRTLLIDADIRRPQVRSIFGLDQAPSLLEVLRGNKRLDLRELESGVENLSVLAAAPELSAKSHEKGPRSDNTGKARVRPSELLGSRMMREFLRSMREEFDIIIIDAPPVMAATDAAVLSTQCDATIVVAQAGKTKEGEVEDSVETLENVGGRIIGVLLNRFDVALAYGQKYKYDYYSKYGLYSKYDDYELDERMLAGNS